MKKAKKPLSLHKETLTHLDPLRLEQAAAGVEQPSYNCATGYFCTLGCTWAMD